MNSYGFKCSCEACVNNYPFIIDNAFKFLGIPLAQSLSIAEHKKNHKENRKKLVANRRNPSDIDMWNLMEINDALKSVIAKCEPFIFKLS